MKIINVNVSRPYDIYVGKDILPNLGELVNKVATSKRVAIITDDIVDRLHSNSVISQLKKTGYTIEKIVLNSGEKFKNKDSLFYILDLLSSHSFNRKDLVIALGGGVVGDISGLAASLYMRGIKIIQVPTTLLAMVDASIGGKTAIDNEYGKNLIGTFYQPSLVFCDTAFLNTLPPDIYKEGFGEIIKYNLIKDFGFFDYVLINTVTEHLEEIIESCIKIKQSVVEQDEFESKQIREVLNIGHTFAHAIEKVSDYLIPHGIAVANGIIYETALSYRLGLCDKSLFDKVYELVSKLGMITEIKSDANALVHAMLSDKKNTSNAVKFVLLEDIGAWKLISLKQDQLISYVSEILK